MEFAATTGELDERARRVRVALAARYAYPIVVVDDDAGVIRVPAGTALELARDAAGGGCIEALDYARLPWHAVPPDGLVLWRQHGRSGADGEVVTQLLAGDPAVQAVVGDAGWTLVRCAAGSQGWIDAGVEQLAATSDPAELLEPVEAIDPDRFVEAVLDQLDAPYVWGGTGIGGVDCSGLVQRAAWQAAGCWLPRHSRALLRVGRRVAPSSIARGDLLVLERDPAIRDAQAHAQLQAIAAEQQRTGVVPAHGPAIHPMHVAVAMSSDEVVHASRDEMRVVREPLESLRSRYRVLGVRRLGALSGELRR